MSTDPLDLFRAAIDALNREDWHALAALCDATSLGEFKNDVLAELTPPPASEQLLTPAQLMNAVPNMPRAVAEYQIARFREAFDPKRRLKELLPAADSRDAIDQMTPVEVFALWLEGRSTRRQLERHVENRRMTRGAAREVIAGGIRRFDFVALGFVHDGPDAVHIVYRRAGGSLPPRTIMARRQDNGEWLLDANKHFLTMDHVQLLAADEEALED